MAKVFTGRGLADCISATVSEESMPPERNAPRGTSEIMRISTALCTSDFSSASVSRGFCRRGWLRARSTASSADQ
jgi:hypothetical protein